jgi:hypothetical protein
MDGKITDIFMDQKGGVQGIAIDGGCVVAWNQDGQPVASTLATQLSPTPGNFTGSPACSSLIQHGGAVKGLVLDGDQVRAILGGFGPLSGESSAPPEATLTQQSTNRVVP